MKKKTQPYSENGLMLSKNSLKVGDVVTLYYNGLLYDCGADTVYARIGYNDEWDEKDFFYMDADEGLFKVTFTVKQSGTMYICFKDGANNWDNNSSENYGFEVI